MKRILKNKITGKYFGHLDSKYENSVDYFDIRNAYRFDHPITGVGFLTDNYNCVLYLKELRRIKIKKLNESIH